jgi:hypothetical protein
MSHSIEDLSAGGSDLLFPRSIGPDELGDSLAQMVWESFSDFISDGDAEALLDELGKESEDGIPDERIAEEMLIYLMWAHTRGVQLAFLGRSPEELVRKSLDAMHRAVFEDMVKNGTPVSRSPSSSNGSAHATPITTGPPRSRTRSWAGPPSGTSRDSPPRARPTGFEPVRNGLSWSPTP